VEELDGAEGTDGAPAEVTWVGAVTGADGATAVGGNSPLKLQASTVIAKTVTAIDKVPLFFILFLHFECWGVNLPADNIWAND
jgi:hypothetical protein